MGKDAKLHIENLENRLALASAVVAVIDSGIDLNHKDLVENIWRNPNEIADGIDNDNNGYIDDINGWDFANKDNNPQDLFGHGTHVAGIIDNVSNNTAIIMPLQFQDFRGVGYTGDAIAAINYATSMKLAGVDIVAMNLSWGGGTGVSSLLQSAILAASNAGIIVVMAAGNNGSNNDVTPRYPSSYKYENTISVASLNSDLTLAGYSNYGPNSVDVATIGTGVKSTLPGNTYGIMSGTSMAAPRVTGAVVIIKNEHNQYAASQIKNEILSKAIMPVYLSDKVKYGYLSIDKPLVVAPIEIIKTELKVSINKRKVNIDINNNGGVVINIRINGIRRYNITTSKDHVEININKYLTKRINKVEVSFRNISSNKLVTVYSGSINR